MKSIIYEILYKDIVVDEVFLPEDKNNIVVTKMVDNKMMQPFNMAKISLSDFYAFIKSRCYEDERINLDKILDQAGLKDNNPYEWIKVTHGITWEDFFWIREKGENITWEEVKLRD